MINRKLHTKFDQSFITSLIIILLLAISIVITPHSATALQQDPTIQDNLKNPLQNPLLFDLEFPGGTISDYVTAIRDVLPDANIVVDAGAKIVQIDQMTLKNVTLDIAMEILNTKEVIVEDKQISIRVKVNDGSSIGEGISYYKANSAYNIISYTQSRKPEPDLVSEVYPLGDLLEYNLTPEDILTVIQLTLDMSEDIDDNPPIIKFHEETGLLLVRASSEVTNIIIDIINTLSESEYSRQMKQRDLRKQQADNQLQQIQAQIAIKAKEAEIKLAQDQAMLQEKMLELEKARILLQNEAAKRESLESALNDIRIELKDHKDWIVLQGAEIERMKEKLADK